MKPHERRAAGAYPCYRVAVYDERLACWREQGGVYDSIAAAYRSAPAGRCRLSRIDETGRTDLEVFDGGPEPVRR